jgi:hypothetical protein
MRASSRGETCAHFLVHGWSPSPAPGGAGRGFALALGSPHASAWPWPSNMVAAPTACDLGTSGSTFSNSACDAHRLSRVTARAAVRRAHPPLCASSPHRCSAASVCPASVARQATLFVDGLARARPQILKQVLEGQNTVSPITFGSGKQLFPGLTATGINSVRGALPVEIIDSLHFKLYVFAGSGRAKRARRNIRSSFTDSGRTLRVETERKKGGSESEGSRKAEVNREREREV